MTGERWRLLRLRPRGPSGTVKRRQTRAKHASQHPPLKAGRPSERWGLCCGRCRRRLKCGTVDVGLSDHPEPLHWEVRKRGRAEERVVPNHGSNQRTKLMEKLARNVSPTRQGRAVASCARPGLERSWVANNGRVAGRRMTWRCVVSGRSKRSFCPLQAHISRRRPWKPIPRSPHRRVKPT